MRDWLAGLATIALRRPWLGAGLVGLLAVASVGFVLFGPLEVSTSRRGLVSDEEPGQARLMRHFERFGRPDAAVFVVSGGSQPERRMVAGGLIQALSEMPGLDNRILGRLDMRLLAEVLPLNHPQLVDGFAPLAAIEGDHTGLADIIMALERRILANLDGDRSDAGDDTDIARIVPLVRAFDAELRGDESKDSWIGLAEGNGLASHTNLDELGYLTSSDGEHYLVVTFPDLISDEGKDVAPVINGMRAIRDRVLAEADVSPAVRIELSGLPALATDELAIVTRGLSITSILAMLGIALLLAFAFRSVRQMIVALVPLGAGVVIALGFVELAFDDLNLITSSFLSLLMGLGIDLAVHLLYRYQEERRSGMDVPSAMGAALVGAGPGIATGAITTALAFATITTTDFTAFSELGTVTAFGLVIMLICAFVLIPPLIRWLAAKKPAAAAPEFPGGGAAMALVRRHPRTVLGSALVISALAVVGFSTQPPAFNGRYFDFLPKDTESYRGLQKLEADRMLGPTIVNLEASALDEARRLAERLRATPEVGAVYSATDLLPPLSDERLASLKKAVRPLAGFDAERLRAPATPTPVERIAGAVVALQDAFDELAFALEQGARDPAPARDASAALSALAKTLRELSPDRRAVLAGIERDVADIARRVLVSARTVAERGRYLPGDLPPLFRLRYVSKDGSALALFAYPAGDIWDPAFARHFGEVIREIQPEASGLALDIPRHEEMIVGGFERAAIYAALLVALMLLITFRSIRQTALALFPVAVGWAWMLGVMPLIGLTFDHANVVALPLVLGIGVDSGVHMIHRFRESSRSGERAQLSDLVRGTGSAILVSSLTTMIGFAALTAGGYGAMVSMGLLVVTGIGFCLIASLLVLPALLVVVGRAE